MARADLDDALATLERVSVELQHEVMQTRMVPVGNIFNRFPRMVRDLARDLGKDVTFEMDGLDIELDRTVLDEIGDPLVHLLRNASITASSLPRTVPLRASPLVAPSGCTPNGNAIRFGSTVSDDGRGMDVERIWAKAVERGIVDRSARETYSEHDVFMLVCMPGFTTKETATRVSGRGVGMDVVRGKIEYLGGTIHVVSAPGEGMEVTLILPLTLAIIQALLVGNCDRVFALPLNAVDEVLPPDEVRSSTIDGRPVVVLRDGTAVALQRLSALCEDGDDPTEQACIRGAAACSCAPVPRRVRSPSTGLSAVARSSSSRSRRCSAGSRG